MNGFREGRKQEWKEARIIRRSGSKEADERGTGRKDEDVYRI